MQDKLDLNQMEVGKLIQVIKEKCSEETVNEIGEELENL